MMESELKPYEKLVIEENEYEVAPHPVISSMSYVQEGWKSRIYKIYLRSTKEEYALKVFKPAFRLDYIVNNNKFLKQFQEIPGFRVSKRYIVTRPTDIPLIDLYPDLEFSVLMPWIGNYLWSSIIAQWIYLSRNTCFSLAYNFVKALNTLEQKGFAHCDIAGDNVIVNLETLGIELLDIEDMYGEGFEHPGYLSIGGYGYQHKKGDTGIWTPFGDRFAGAILLSEMLVWHNIEIRSDAFGESYFSPDEMQDPQSNRYHLIIKYLGKLSDKFAELFERTWHSYELKDCPKIKEWFEECERVITGDHVKDQQSLQLQLLELRQQVESGFDDLKLGQVALYKYINTAYQSSLDEIIKAISKIDWSKPRSFK